MDHRQRRRVVEGERMNALIPPSPLSLRERVRVRAGIRVPVGCHAHACVGMSGQRTAWPRKRGHGTQVAVAIFVAIGALAVAMAASADDATTAKPQLPNPFFAFDNGTGRGRIPFDQQAKMLKELGYDGIGFDGVEQIPEMLKDLDAVGLKMFSIYLAVWVDPKKPPYDPRLRTAIEQLQGRDTLIWITVVGGKPSSDGLDDRAVTIFREIADVAARSGLRVAPLSAQRKLRRAGRRRRAAGEEDRPQNLGVSFNLCHFLWVDDAKNLELRLKEARPYLMAVSINGADGEETNKLSLGRLIQTLDRGSFDVGRVLIALKRLNYTGPIGLQGFMVPGDVRDNLAHSMSAWRKLSARAAAER